MGETIRLAVTVTDDELRKWAEWHADHNHHGVAAILYAALEKVDAVGDAHENACAANERVREVARDWSREACVGGYRITDGSDSDSQCLHCGAQEIFDALDKDGA